MRRKLARLETKGWVESNAALGWRLSRSTGGIAARDDLLELDKRSIDRLVRMIAALLPLLADLQSTQVDPDATD